jgi:hypothetical protein
LCQTKTVTGDFTAWTMENLKISVELYGKWNRVGSKCVPANVVERRMQHATFLKIPVATAFNN